MNPWSVETPPKRPFLASLGRGLRERCPNCGKGKLFYRYLKVSPRCSACGHDLERYPADDGPAYFTILIVGHLVVAPMLFFMAPAIWKGSLWLIVPAMIMPVLAITLIALPRFKGAVLGALYALDIHRGDAALHTADAAE